MAARAKLYLIPLAAAVLLAVGIYWMRAQSSPTAGGPRPITLTLHCGAALRPPVEEIVGLFGRRTEVRVEVNYGASNLLLGQLQLTRAGDVFLPGDDFYLEQARAEGLIGEVRQIAWFVPVIMVGAGNPHGIAEVRDLVRPGVRLGLADERAAAIGRVTPEIFERSGVSAEAVRAATVFTSVTSPELAQAVALGHVDAAIVWAPVARQYLPRTEVVEIAPERNLRSPVAAGTIATSEHPEAAAEFLAFLAGTVGREVFLQHHYELAGDNGAAGDGSG